MRFLGPDRRRRGYLEIARDHKPEHERHEDHPARAQAKPPELRSPLSRGFRHGKPRSEGQFTCDQDAGSRVYRETVTASTGRPGDAILLLTLLEPYTQGLLKTGFKGPPIRGKNPAHFFK